MSGNIHLLFPVAIYYEDNVFDKKQNTFWAKKIIKMSKDNLSGTKWEGDTNTSHSVFYLFDDKDFLPLLDVLQNRIKVVAEALHSQGTYNCDHAWYNINKKNTYQEFHYHNHSIFSGVYYVQIPKNSGGLLFDDPKPPDMLPLKNMSDNNITYQHFRFDTKPGRLIIFRSYMRHSTERQKSSKPRISISFNFS